MNSEPYGVLFAPPARRAIASKLPEPVAAATAEFCLGPLASNPRRVGKPLRGDLDGYCGARRGDYRTIYRIDDDEHVVYVVDIAHRGNVFRDR